jgi:hypothetical protein
VEHTDGLYFRPGAGTDIFLEIRRKKEDSLDGNVAGVKVERSSHEAERVKVPSVNIHPKEKLRGLYEDNHKQEHKLWMNKTSTTTHEKGRKINFSRAVLRVLRFCFALETHELNAKAVETEVTDVDAKAAAKDIKAEAARVLQFLKMLSLSEFHVQSLKTLLQERPHLVSTTPFINPACLGPQQNGDTPEQSLHLRTAANISWVA